MCNDEGRRSFRMDRTNVYGLSETGLEGAVKIVLPDQAVLLLPE